jgi:hypothetical protein
MYINKNLELALISCYTFVVSKFFLSKDHVTNVRIVKLYYRVKIFENELITRYTDHEITTRSNGVSIVIVLYSIRNCQKNNPTKWNLIAAATML